MQAQTSSQDGELVFETKPVSTEGCTYEYYRNQPNVTLKETSDEEFHLHHISYLYYSVLGTIITIVIAFIISLFVGFKNSSDIDSKLLAPCIRNYFLKPDFEMSVKNVSVKHEFNITHNQIK